MSAKPPVKFALIALSVSLVWILIEHVAGWNTTRHDIGQYTRMLPMVLFWVLIFVAVNQSRGQRTAYSFSEGLRDGLVMSLIYCAGFTLVILGYQKFINPEFYETLKSYMVAQLNASNLSEEEMKKALDNMELSFSGSAASYFLLFLYSFGWGLILSAIAARVYRKK